jgi:hypothetical protein
MGPNLSDRRPRKRGQIGAIRWIGLFMVAWALSALSGPAPRVAESADHYEVAPSAQALLAVPSADSRPPIVPFGGTPPARFLVPFGRPMSSGHTRSAERRDPPPSLFHRVSYRTSAPPSKNG